MVTFVTDSNNEKSVSDRHTFQVGDDIYEEDVALIPKPNIQFTSNQIKWLQMKDSLLAIIMDKLQKGTCHYQTPIFNTDGALYHCVREDSQGFEAVGVPKKLY